MQRIVPESETAAMKEYGWRPKRLGSETAPAEYGQLPQPASFCQIDGFEGGKVCQALHTESKNIFDVLCRVKKCLGRSM